MNSENVNQLVYESVGPEDREQVDISESLEFDSPNVKTEPTAQPVSNVTSTAKEQEAEKPADTLENYFKKINDNYLEVLQKAQVNRTNPVDQYTTTSVSEGPVLDSSELFNTFRKRLAAAESDNNYAEINPQAKSGAWGKYQFIWGTGPGRGQRDYIKKVTGHTTPEGFLRDSMAQEKYFKWYYDNTLTKELKNFRKEFPQIKWNDVQTLEALHFRGYNGLSKYIREGRLDQSDSINPSVNSRLFKKIDSKRLNAKSRFKLNEASLAEMNKRLGYS